MGITELLTQGKFCLPEIMLLLCGLAVLAIELTGAKHKNTIAAWVCTGAFAATGVLLALQIKSNLTQSLFYGAYFIMPLLTWGKLIILVAGLLTVVMSLRYVAIHKLDLAEYLYLLSASMLGMFILISADSLILLFLGLELLSFPIYILTGMKTSNERSCEASLKYIVMGSFSSALFVFGIALIYGATGATQVSALAGSLASRAITPLLALGLVFVITGFGFKLSLAPFHAWTPDVYEGAPMPITAFMSVAIKAAAFVVFFRTFSTLTLPIFLNALAVIALLSIIVGNFYGLTQTNFKRLIAYSSIAHAGYILLAFLDTNRAQSNYAMLFYVLNYTFMNLAALFVLIYLTTREKYVENISDLQGVGWQRPLLGLTMTVAMLSLAGLPPLPGFLAKFYIFKSALQGGYIVTVVIALIATLISLYYYVRVLAVMYMEDSCALSEQKQFSLPAAITIGLTTLIICYIALFPNHILSVIR